MGKSYRLREKENLEKVFLHDWMIVWKHKSESWEQQAEYVKEVFEKIKQYGFKLTLDDVNFSKSKIKN